jgi:hypothetical protein
LVSKRKLKKKRLKPYSKGELNRLVDSICHPFYDENEAFRAVDGLLHAIIERDPPQSLRKFIHYNLPDVIKKISKKANRTARGSSSAR